MPAPPSADVDSRQDKVVVFNPRLHHHLLMVTVAKIKCVVVFLKSAPEPPSADVDSRQDKVFLVLFLF